ncbi:alkaline phosphatase family protein [bacterium]|nr:alkaline phosphatase family protein [candidate division CSSED10-310 bacterium]
MKQPKLIVLGLDGASFNILLPLVEAGHMPGLGKVLERGVWGNLASVIPPVTAPAWASFMTGCLPGRHGVHGFECYIPGTSTKQWVDSRVIKIKKLWHWINRGDLTTGVINMPITYPAESLNGYLISGFLTPLNAATPCFPPEILDEVTASVGEYIINVPVMDEKPSNPQHGRDLMKRLMAAAETRFRAMEFLMAHRPVDALICVYMLLDKWQHLFGALLDPECAHAVRGARLTREELIAPYRQIDDFITAVTERLGDDSHLLIVSDHGFGGLKRTFFLNNWLEEQGFLRLKSGRVMRRLIQRLHTRGDDRNHPVLHGRIFREDLGDLIDWSTTRAYCGDVFTQGVFVNLKGRESSGIVAPGADYDRVCEELRSRLLDIRDGITGRPFVNTVHRTSELYPRADLRDAPDLFVEIDEYATIISPTYLFRERGHHVRDNHEPIGYHRKQGVFIGIGPAFAPARDVQGLRIIDMCPLILHLLGVPIPFGLDGSLPEAVLDAGWLSNHPARYDHTDISASGYDNGATMTPEQAREIHDRLRGLGYLD